MVNTKNTQNTFAIYLPEFLETPKKMIAKVENLNAPIQNPCSGKIVHPLALIIHSGEGYAVAPLH